MKRTNKKTQNQISESNITNGKVLQGKIMKGIGGFYYVRTLEGDIYECRARGVFRNKKLKPLVGDEVTIDVISEEEKTAYVSSVLMRKNELIRPASSNVDQAIVIFAAKDPAPNYILLDKFLVMIRQLNLPVILCFNKTDLITEEYKAELASYYEGAATLYFISVNEGKGMQEIREILRGKTSVLAGPSGVGKSSFLNHFCPDSDAETGAVSDKIGRGRHTTRHAELFFVEEDTWLMDTPGFSSLDLFDLEDKELRFYYPEYESYEGACRFNGCVHVAEPDCAVKQAVSDGKISNKRYEAYCYIYDELHRKKKKY